MGVGRELARTRDSRPSSYVEHAILIAVIVKIMDPHIHRTNGQSIPHKIKITHTTNQKQ
jgi:hypothetical protein